MYQSSVEPVGIEVVDHQAAACVEDARRLGECQRPIEVVDDGPHQRPVEPPVAKRQVLGGGPLEDEARHALLPGDGEHLRRRVDGPDAAGVVRREGGGERARPAADVEHAPAAQVARGVELGKQGLEAGVERTELVVACGDPAREPGGRGGLGGGGPVRELDRGAGQASRAARHPPRPVPR